MPVRLCVAHRVAHHVRSIPSAHVWISDDLLQQSFHAFTSARYNATCKRHGSNVPGPLEARRRSTKRRMGYLGAIGQYGGPPSLDTALTFGWFGDRRGTSVQQQELNWLPPGAVDVVRRSKHQYPDLPAWLDVKRPDTAEIIPDFDKILGVPLSLKPVSADEYKSRIDQTSTLQDIRDLNKEIGHAVSDTRLCSIIAFKRLLAEYESLQTQYDSYAVEVTTSRDVLFEYIEDEKMEHSNGQNLIILMKSLDNTELSLQQYSILRRHTFKAFSLFAVGTPWPGTVKSRLLVSLVDHSVNVSTTMARPDIVLELLEELWCFELQDTKLPWKVRARMIHQVAKLPISSRSIHLITEILNDVPADISSSQVESICRVVRKIIAHDLEQQDPLTFAPLEEESKLSAFLATSNREVLARLARIITLDLSQGLQNVEERLSALKCLSFWVNTLRSVRDSVWHVGLSPEEIETTLDNVAAVAKPVEVLFVFHDLQGEGIAHILMRHWLPRAEPAPGFQGSSVGGNTEAALKDAWIRSFTGLERSSGHFLNFNQVAQASLIKAARDHGLDWEAVFLDLLNLAKALSHQVDVDAMVRGLKRLNGKSTLTIKHREFLVDFINQESSGNVFSALRVFNTDTRLFLSDQPNLIPALLKAPEINPGGILALLKRVDRHAQVVPGLRKHNIQCALSDERIDLIHKVALGMATTNRFTCREASSSVHYCWRLLKLHSAPMDERLAQAAVVAGILRPLTDKEWIPTRQFRWALNVVSSIHGEEVASEIDRMAYAMRSKQTWLLSPPPARDLDRRTKKDQREIGGLTPVQKSIVSEGNDVLSSRVRQWRLYVRAAKGKVGRTSGLRLKGVKPGVIYYAFKSEDGY